MTWTSFGRSCSPCMHAATESSRPHVRFKGTPQIDHEKRIRFSCMSLFAQIAMAASFRALLVFSVCLRIAAAITVQEACQQHTKYPELCVQALSSAKPATDAGPPAGLPEMAEIAVGLAEQSNTAMVAFVKVLESQPGGMPPECLEQCVGQFQAAVTELKRSEVALEQFGENATGVKGWVEAAKADGDTCMRSCHKIEGGADPDIDGKIAELGKLCSIALSLTDASVRNRAA